MGRPCWRVFVGFRLLLTDSLGSAPHVALGTCPHLVPAQPPDSHYKPECFCTAESLLPLELVGLSTSTLLLTGQPSALSAMSARARGLGAAAVCPSHSAYGGNLGKGPML